MNVRSRIRTASASVMVLLAASLITATGANAATPPPTPPDAPPGSATTYQMNSVHDGVATGSLASPLYQAWSRDIGTSVSYPLAVNGRVFAATANPSGAYGTQLWALNAEDGSTIWGPLTMSGTYWFAGIAADGANVYDVNANGLMRAIDQATGREVWSVQLPGQYSFSSSPTVSHGVIYVGGAGSGGTLYAIAAATGAVLWTAGVENGDGSSPAVTNDGVYVSYACGITYRFDPLTGARAWVRTTGCEGGGGSTPVVHDGEVYVRDGSYPGVLNAATGVLDGTFDSSTAPAFSGDVGFYLQGATLRGVDTATNQVLWSQATDGGLNTAPIVIGSEVAIGSSTGEIYLLNAQNGFVDWSANTGSNSGGVIPGAALAASGGQLLVPTSRALVAYAHLDVGRAFVTALYQDFLGRTVDTGGVNYWLGKLASGVSRSSVASTIAFSNEATKYFVNGQYQAILSRAADASGLQYWSSLAISSLNANRVSESLYASSEYFAAAGGTDAGWVQAIYRDILGRPASSADVGYWTSQFDRIGRVQISTFVFSSAEAARKRINDLYVKLLGRSADDGGLAFYLVVVEHTGTAAAAATIASSDEYAARALTRMEQ